MYIFNFLFLSFSRWPAKSSTGIDLPDNVSDIVHNYATVAVMREPLFIEEADGITLNCTIPQYPSSSAIYSSSYTVGQVIQKEQTLFQSQAAERDVLQNEQVNYDAPRTKSVQSKGQHNGLVFECVEYESVTGNDFPSDTDSEHSDSGSPVEVDGILQSVYDAGDLL